MSRLGKLPIILPAGVTATLSGHLLVVKGPKGELKQDFNSDIIVTIEETQILVSKNENGSKKASVMWGLYRTLFANMVEGVSAGFVRKLEINGVGYRANVAGNRLNMALGFSHPIEFDLPEGITALVEGNIITLNGFDKKLIGETAARIRKIRKPEPYKGKGVKYLEEVLRRKAGKSASKGK